MQYVMLIATFCIQVPFFSDDEETPSSTPKADALFIPRENPRSLVIRPIEQWPMRASVEKASPLKESTSVHENGNLLIAFNLFTLLYACPIVLILVIGPPLSVSLSRMLYNGGIKVENNLWVCIMTL